MHMFHGVPVAYAFRAYSPVIYFFSFFNAFIFAWCMFCLVFPFMRASSVSVYPRTKIPDKTLYSFAVSKALIRRLRKSGETTKNSERNEQT